MLLGEVHYYEIFLLGLKWLSENDGEWDRPRSLSPILYTLKEIKLIDEKQRKAAMRNRHLLDKLYRGIVVCHDEAGHRQHEVRAS